MRHRPSQPLPPILAETLVLWGVEDRFLETALAAEAANRCRSARVQLVEATHWLQAEEPEAVNEALLGFFEQG